MPIREQHSANQPAHTRSLIGAMRVRRTYYITAIRSTPNCLEVYSCADCLEPNLVSNPEIVLSLDEGHIRGSRVDGWTTVRAPTV